MFQITMMNSGNTMEMFRIILMTSIFLPMIAAFLVWLFSDQNRQKASVYVIAVSIIELILALILVLLNTENIVHIPNVMGLGLHFTYSGFRGIFGVLSAFVWVITLLFSKDYMQKDTKVLRFDFYYLLTLGAVFGIFFAADFVTLLLFFEVMSFTSFMWVAHRQTKEALYAAGTYLGIAVAGGLAILMGIFLLYQEFGTVMFAELASLSTGDSTRVYVAACCMFAGFGAKASAFPVHAWLPQSYTEAPAPATTALSAILSKTGIFGIICISCYVLQQNESWGMFILIIGMITMVLGGIRGVCSNNLKTTLAYSSMSQIGFILVGIGMYGLLKTESVLAARGTLLHMVNHSLGKLVLFLLAGIVFAQVGSYDLNQVRGFGRRKPFLMTCFVLAAAGIGGIPLLNGYVSKTLLHESIVEYRELIAQGAVWSAESFTPMLNLFQGIEYLFLFSGGLTLAYMTKLFVVLFIEKNQDEKKQRSFEENKNYISWTQKIAIAIGSVPILLIGLLPHLTADQLMKYGAELMIDTPLSEQVAYFSLTNLSGALISIVVAVLVYLVAVRGLMLRKKGQGYLELWPAWLDTEKYLYRNVCYRMIPFVLGVVSRILDSLLDWCVVFLRKSAYRDRKLPHELTEGDSFTHAMGHGMEVIHNMYCKMAHKPCKKAHYEHKLALKEEDFVENFKIIERSLSFGLFMFCIGLALTLLYLLLAN